MTDQKRPTLQTIADAVGVSRTTVSNAYNRPRELAAGLRARILTVAAELGYPGPDPAARNLRVGRHGSIGVVFTETLSAAFKDPTAVALLHGLARASESSEVGVLLLPVRSGDEVDTTAIRSASVDGFVVYSVASDSAAVGTLLDRRLPIVTVDEPDLGAGHGYIGIDDRAGAHAVASHLLELGHRSVTVVVGRIVGDGRSGWSDAERRSATTSRVIADRFAGYRDALAERGVDWADVPVYEVGANTPEAARDAAGRLLGGRDRPTAILATSDQLALGVLHEAASRGIDVPGELSVAGFDDVPRARVSNPPLTTVRQPLAEKGERALRMLRDDAPERVLLPIELAIRESTSTVPERSRNQ